jgi:hypothetical protein
MGIDLGTFLDVTRDIQDRTYNKKSLLKKNTRNMPFPLPFPLLEESLQTLIGT